MSHEGQNLVAYLDMQQDAGRSQRYTTSNPIQPWKYNYDDFPPMSAKLLSSILNETPSMSPADLGSNAQIYFQPIPEALQRSGVTSVGYHQMETKYIALPQGYPVWHHPRIGHFSPVQHDPEFGYYVPVEDPCALISTSVPASARFTLGSELDSEHLEQLNLHGEKRSAPNDDTVLLSKRQKLTNTTHGRISTRTTDVPTGQKSPDISVKKNACNVVQSCICRNGPVLAPRPSNAFFLYKSQHSKLFTRRAHEARDNGDRLNDSSAKQASLAWNAETKEVKQRFKALAETEKIKHAQMYPDYRYEPNKKQANRFGDRNCTCGAYEVNCAALKSKPGDVGKAQNNARNHNTTDTVSVDFGDHEYLQSPRRSPSVSQDWVPTDISSFEHIDPYLLESRSDAGPITGLTYGEAISQPVWCPPTSGLIPPQMGDFDFANAWTPFRMTQDEHTGGPTGAHGFDFDLTSFS